MDQLAEEIGELAAEEAEKAQALAVSTESFTPESVAAAETALRGVQQRMAGKQKQLARVEKELRQEIRAREQHMQEVMHRTSRAIDTAMEPINKLVSNLQEGLKTMGLYLGRGEEIVPIREGEKAPAEETIYVRQMVLAMDEETGIFAEDGGIDADRVEEFDQWLLADEKHVAQIVPETKCVVAVVPRWRERNEERRSKSGNPEDQLTHFIIRNGECLYRTSVDFHAGDHLIPKADEFAGVFTRQGDDEPIRPNTREYAKAMEQTEGISRRFLRIGLILQGLIDRTEIFDPLHPAGINMLVDAARHPEKLRFVMDGGEGALDSGQQTFKEWQAETNKQLRVGMRIVGAFDGELWRDANVEGYERNRKQGARVHPKGWNAPNPKSAKPYVLETIAESGYKFLFDRGTVYDRWRERPAKQRASCTVYAEDEFIIAYDLADAALMRRFLGDRRNRRDYKQLWPLIRSVMTAKEAEEATEAPFRQMLAGVLARENGVTVEDTEKAVPELIRWFKLGNRYHRPLTLDDLGDVEDHKTPRGRSRSDAPEREQVERAKGRREAHESKAVRLIVAEHKRRLKDAGRKVDEKLVATLARTYPAYLLIARTRQGEYVVVLPEEPDRNIYVREIRFSAKGAERSDKRWLMVGARGKQWSTIRESERWADWDRMANPVEHITVPERDELVRQLTSRSAPRGEQLIGVITQKGDADAQIELWTVDDNGFLEFSAENPLKARLHRGPELHFHGARWSRKATTAPKLSTYMDGAYVTGRYDPWESKEDKAKRKSETHLRPWEQGGRRVLYLDRALVDRYDRMVADWADAERYSDGAWSMYGLIMARLRRGWESTHDTSKDSMPSALEAHRHYSSGADEQLEGSIAEAFVRGELYDGMPIEEVWQLAVGRGMMGAYVPDKRIKGMSSWEDDVPALFPEEVAGLKIDLSPASKGLVANEGDEEPGDEEPDDTPELDEDQLDADVALIKERLTETVEKALAPEPEPEKPIVSMGDGIDILDAE
jgi:hypothetical protein